MNEIVENFQFIRPIFLLVLLPILFFYIWHLLYGKQENLWQQIIPSHLYQGMTVQKGIAKSSKFIHFIFVATCIAVISAAGPSWEKLPQAVYQTQSGKVILIDMSMSMRSTDVSPNRLQRAKFKAIDLVNELNEGETGLIAYAGDAFVVSPLTDDAGNLKTLIPALSPEIMPSQGSYALMGLEKASELLQNAGYQSGEIYWLTDGIRSDEIREIRDFIQQSQYELSALLIGTESGAPILLSDGQMLKDNTGKIVVPSINERFLNQAFAGTSANYELFSSDNSDIAAIKRRIALSQQQDAELIENTTGDAFKDMGPYLCLLLLPIALYSFRRGVLIFAYVGLVSLFTFPVNTSVYAMQAQSSDNPQSQSVNSNPNTQNPSITLANPDAKPESMLDLAFKNANQRGKIAFDNSNYSKAAELFKDESWQAASAYKTGDYEVAEKLYRQLYARLGGSENLYNKANALAKQGKLQEALDAYQQVLNEQPEHEKALKNKKIVEDLLNQQQQQEQQENSESEQQDPNGDNSEQQDQNQNSQNQDQQNNQQSDQQNDAEDSQQSQEQEDNQEQEQSTQNQQNEGEQSNDESLQDQAKQQNEKEQKQETDAQNQQQQAQTTQQNELNDEQQNAISNEINMDDLTPEEQEELQRMQMILNKVPDDPAYLLKRKMLLEAYKRKRTQPPTTQENW